MKRIGHLHHPSLFAILLASSVYRSVGGMAAECLASPRSPALLVQAKVLSIAADRGRERPAPDASILLRLMPDGDEYRLVREDEFWRLEDVAPEQDPYGFDVRIKPSELFSDRTFQLTRSSLGPLTSDLVFYVIARDVLPAPALSERFKFEPPSEFPAKVTTDDQTRIDRAVAYFEDSIIKQEDVGGREEDPRLWVVDSYNYGVALYNACLLGYSTCEPASTACGDLLDLLDNDADIRVYLSAPKYRENLLLCRRLHEVRAAQEEWRGLKEMYENAMAMRVPNKCQPHVAAMLAAVATQEMNALQSYDSRAAEWRAVRIAKYAFARDAGVAQYSRGEILSVCELEDGDGSPHESCGILRSSLKLLTRAVREGDPWSSTTRARDSAARRIRSCPSDA